jgi:hypothetical protein
VLGLRLAVALTCVRFELGTQLVVDDDVKMRNAIAGATGG